MHQLSVYNEVPNLQVDKDIYYLIYLEMYVSMSFNERLYVAVRNNDIDGVIRMLDLGATYDCRGSYPININPDIIKLLLKKDDNITRALYNASHFGFEDVIEFPVMKNIKDV